MKRFASAVALASGLALAASNTVFAAAVVLVSGPSPYNTPSCLALNAGQIAATPRARNFLNAEVEPQVAFNPTDSTNLIGAWQQDRWSNGGAHGLVAGFSFDGGATWGETTLPFSRCAGTGAAPYERASDPWVSIGPDGTAYANAISFDDSTPRNAVTAATSTDGGQTWTNLTVLAPFNTSQFFNDKNSVTADPVNAGVAYQVWDTLESPTDQPDDNIHAQAFTGPAVFSKTTDGGLTWSKPRIIIDTVERQQTIGNVIVVDPRTDTLYDFTDLIIPPNTPFIGANTHFTVAVVKSSDGGATWSAPRHISDLNSLGVIDPNTGQPIRTGDIIPEPAIDPASGQLYVVWQASTNFRKSLTLSAGGFDNEILLSTSTDGGATWSSPTVVHMLPSGLPTFTATVAVNSTHTVGVTYYDFRNLRSGNTTTLPTDYWINFSTDFGKTFSSEQHISGPFNMLSAPFARGFFVGDYEGLKSGDGTFQPFFVQTNCTSFNPDTGSFAPDDPACAPASSTKTATSNTNPTDVFTTTVTP